jgi:transposase-like protein
MGRPKGGNNRYWSKEEKLRIVKMIVEEHKTSLDVSMQEKISNGMLSTWVKKYISGGMQALENSRKPGNPLNKYQNKKQLTDLEQLQFENMKLRIENERLKKGYIVEGDGQVTVFNISKDRNMK